MLTLDKPTVTPTEVVTIPRADLRIGDQVLIYGGWHHVLDVTTEAAYPRHQRPARYLHRVQAVTPADAAHTYPGPWSMGLRTDLAETSTVQARRPMAGHDADNRCTRCGAHIADPHSPNCPDA